MIAALDGLTGEISRRTDKDRRRAEQARVIGRLPKQKVSSKWKPVVDVARKLSAPGLAVSNLARRIRSLMSESREDGPAEAMTAAHGELRHFVVAYGKLPSVRAIERHIGKVVDVRGGTTRAAASDG